MEQTTEKKPSKLQAQLVELAYSPVKFRVVLTIVLVGSWYVAFAMPRVESIETTTKAVVQDRKRLDLARSVEHLRKQVGRFQDRIPTGADPNEWVQYILSGSRLYSLKVANLEANGRKEAGPYKAVVVRMDVEGSFRDVDGFLRWVESNHRLLRVDGLTITPQQKGGEAQGEMKASMVILGVYG